MFRKPLHTHKCRVSQIFAASPAAPTQSLSPKPLNPDLWSTDHKQRNRTNAHIGAEQADQVRRGSHVVLRIRMVYGLSHIYSGILCGLHSVKALKLQIQQRQSQAQLESIAHGFSPLSVVR